MVARLEQLLKTYPSIVKTLAGNVMLLRLEQRAKASSESLVTVLGNDISVKDEHL